MQKNVNSESDSKEGSRNLTPQRTLKLTDQPASSTDLEKSLISPIVFLRFIGTRSFSVAAPNMWGTLSLQL